jgi:predicted O-methyltransferase YrrM
VKGTVLQKFRRLIGDLASHPRYLGHYVQHNLLNGRSPLDLEIPWFSYAAIDFLKLYLRPHMSVFEYGSGGSTVFFARRTRQVCSVEDNPAWFERVSKRLQDLALDNATLRLCRFDFKEPRDFERSDYLNALPEGPFDVIVVDGSEEWTQVRPRCFQRAEARIRPGGIIVLDDSWRYPDVRQSHKARTMEIFQSVGPCRPGVTSTDVFFY